MVHRLCAALVVLALVASGCSGSSGPMATVQGAVLVDGEPVERGLISFTPMQSDSGKAVTAEILNGRYQSSAVPMGRVLVQIHATKETGKTLTDPSEGGEYAETVDIVPEKYKSGIEITVSEPEESHDFDLALR